ncbi:MAG: 50S ribosomal protein L15 [Alphaproteobacteria bacterium]|nr:50S ribosomal protein L15 [Alphaproteobacteria bacterium]MBF0391603.1 50S ribosomal protein L15 [Alphaproteobacteria bacterium]
MKLNELRDNPGSHKSRMRVGRGIGSGKGKTAGRGVKGQTSRTGVAVAGFEGGQMPIYRRLPKRGFTNIFRKEYAIINLSTLQAAITAGKLDANAKIDADALIKAGVVTHKRDGIRLLGHGELSVKVTVEVCNASRPAVAGVEKAGGTVIETAPKAAPEEAAA